MTEWQPGALLTLQTDRFELHSMTREDVTDTFISWLADPDTMLGLNLPQQRLSRAQAVRFVLGFDNRARFCLGIFPRAGSQIGLFVVECNPRSRCADTSVVVGDRAWWGRDVVRETREALLAFLFGPLAQHKVIGRPHGRNFASIYNYKALGFRCEGVLREHLLAVDGKSRLDQLIFGLLRSEWLARHAERRK